MTQRRTKWKAGLVIAIAVIFLVTMFAISLACAGGSNTANAATEFGSKGLENYKKVNNGDAAAFKGYNATVQNAYAPQKDENGVGIVNEPMELCYVFFCSSASGTYKLANDFLILDSGWSNAAPENKCTLDGDDHEIWNAASISSAAAGTDYIGGLVGQNSGTIKNLVYYFNGGIYAKKVASAPYLAVGGMVGRPTT